VPPSVHITTTLTKTERAWVVEKTRASYWGKRLTVEQVEISLVNSLCFIANAPDHAPVGFLRILTDHATVSTITDLFVDEKWRRQGEGTKLVETALAHPWVRTTICILESRDASKLYERLRFVMDFRGVLKRMPG
jgi:GNAT superfamily N-acetyltransferase